MTVKETLVLKFPGQIVSFTPLFDVKDTMQSICKVECIDKRLRLGNKGVPLFLDRRIHKVFLPLAGKNIILSGEIKIEFLNGIAKNAVLFVDNSELLLNLFHCENQAQISTGITIRRVLLG